MAIRGKGAQPTEARTWVQAAAWVLLGGVLPLLAGCSSVPDSINPVSWWHGLQGGEIAKQRPPPPGQDEAYPNLATVPERPPAPDEKTLDAITQSLVADRAHAEYLAAATPIPDPSSPTASPALFGQGTLLPPPPPGASMATATLPAAAGPPPPAAPAGPPSGVAPPPAPAPRRPVQSAPLPPLASATPAQPGGKPPAAGPAAPTPASKAAAVAAVPPSAAAASQAAAAAAPVPAAPPAPPRLSGPGAPATAPAMVASASPPVPLPQPADAITVEFVPGSARLPPGAADVLKGVAAKRGSAVLAVTGYGEAGSDDPSAQSAALSLGLSRAQAVANVLTADGVPASAVRVGAEAAGRGASIRLVK